MSDSTVHLSTTPPPAPEDADFALYIDFVRGQGSPSRVFQAADAMIRALQRLDRALCASIDSHIEPILVLEDIQTGSLKIWLKDRLEASNDETLKKLDWKTAVGNYLVRAKYVYIEWANRTDPNATIMDLARNLATTAAITDVRHLPDYAPPSVTELAEATREIDGAKSLLIPGDRMAYLPAPPKPEMPEALITNPIDFDLSVRWPAQMLIDLATKETITYADMPMNLIVKKPDYLGTSMWDFRHGSVAISAKVADSEWLRSFQNRAVDVRPGDALKCLVTVQRSYGHDNELVSETYTITRVEAVLPNEFHQTSIFTIS